VSVDQKDGLNKKKNNNNKSKIISTMSVDQAIEELKYEFYYKTAQLQNGKSLQNTNR